MGYKQCPRCEINWINDDEDLCESCKKTLGIGSGSTTSKPGTKPRKIIKETCKIYKYVDTILKNDHCNNDVTGYKISDSKDNLLGVVLVDLDRHRKGRAIIRFYNELESQFGTWHTIITKTGPVMFTDVVRDVQMAKERGEDYFELWIE